MQTLRPRGLQFIKQCHTTTSSRGPAPPGASPLQLGAVHWEPQPLIYGIQGDAKKKAAGYKAQVTLTNLPWKREPHKLVSLRTRPAINH